MRAEARRILSHFEGRTLTDDDIAADQNGRPFFPGNNNDFNISHSGSLVAVSLVKGKNLRTGCDVERIRPRASACAIAEDFFSVFEREYIFSGGKFNETRFYEIWTLKECFLKLRGLSVFDMADAPSFIDGEGEFSFDAAVSSPLSFYLYELSGDAGERYMLACVIEGDEQPQPEIQWFSTHAAAEFRITALRQQPKH